MSARVLQVHAPKVKRRFLRLPVDKLLEVAFADLVMSADLVDISTRGFRLETSEPVAPGARHELLLGMPGDEGRLVSARVIYCQPIQVETRRYLSGWSTGGDETTVTTMASLVAFLMSVETPEKR